MDLILDISNNNQHVNLAPFKAWLPNVRKAVIAKASEGVHFTDSYFASNREQCRVLGLPFGAYHWFTPGQSPVDQANHVASLVQRLGKTDLRVALDYETPSTQTRAQREVDIHAFGHALEKRLGSFPIFYSFSSFIQTELQPLSQTLGDGLWLADYSINDGHEHPYKVPSPWKKVNLHQFTDKGQIPGYSGHVDLSYGNLNALLAHPWLAKL